LAVSLIEPFLMALDLFFGLSPLHRSTLPEFVMTQKTKDHSSSFD
jgi:hypothetical protein